MVAHLLANQNRGKGQKPIAFSNFFYTDKATQRDAKDQAMVRFFKNKVKADG